MGDNAVLNMDSYSPSEGEPLAVTPDSTQICVGMEVLHLDDLLVDNRSCIKLPRDFLCIRTTPGPPCRRRSPNSARGFGNKLGPGAIPSAICPRADRSNHLGTL